MSIVPISALPSSILSHVSQISVHFLTSSGFTQLLLKPNQAPPLAIVPPPAITVASDVGRCDAQVSLGTPTTAGGTPPITLAADLGPQYSYGLGDQRQRATVNGVWQLPFGVQLSGLYFFGSGQRFSSPGWLAH